MKNLNETNLIFSVGSVDGICTSSALRRHLGGSKEVGLEFCQAFTVDRVDISAWPEGRKVTFVDLAVNNRDSQMTVDFVRRLEDNGHEIVAIIDEHSAEDWLSVFGEEKFEALAVRPVSQDLGDIKSSGALLLRELGSQLDEQSVELCEAADAGDKMDFSTHYGEIVNSAVKSAITDDRRRVYLAQHFASASEPDKKINGWIAEYLAILANHDIIKNRKEDLGDGIFRIKTSGKAIDMTTLMASLYEGGAKVVVMQGEKFIPAERAKRLLSALGTGDKTLDLVAIVTEAGITPLGGFAQKVNVENTDEELAIEAIREVVQYHYCTGCGLEIFHNGEPINREVDMTCCRCSTVV